jgi:hypothetical protein
MKELTPQEIEQRHKKIMDLLYKWRKDGEDMGVSRPLSTDSSKMKAGEIEITLSQKQNLRVTFDGSKWGPEVLVKSIVYNTISVSDPYCSVEV